jgi:hypothetical protein
MSLETQDRTKVRLARLPAHQQVGLRGTGTRPKVYLPITPRLHCTTLHDRSLLARYFRSNRCTRRIVSPPSKHNSHFRSNLRACRLSSELGRWMASFKSKRPLRTWRDWRPGVRNQWTSGMCAQLGFRPAPIYFVLLGLHTSSGKTYVTLVIWRAFLHHLVVIVWWVFLQCGNGYWTARLARIGRYVKPR